MGQIGWAMGIITSAFPAMKEGGRRSWREWHWRELSSPHLTDSTQGGGEVEAEVVVVVSYLQERGKDGQGKGRLLLFYSFFKLGKRFAFSLI
jgi:hypothetical protein